MGLDDLLGLLFLFFFIVLPALQGFLRRGQQMPPDFEPDEILLPGEERRPPAQPPQSGTPVRPAPPPSQPASPPPARPLVSQPSQPPIAKSPPPRRPKSLEEIERERLARSGARPAKELPQVEPGKAKTEAKTGTQWAFSTSTHAILNGVVWHQVLAEPRSQYWRRARKPKR
jgi:hypothetical protein|uniref:Uncharacterized protein n=1 Tax=Meiothermus ruber TaxID=277 RepID=A0A7C3I362_MEIRU